MDFCLATVSAISSTLAACFVCCICSVLPVTYLQQTGVYARDRGSRLGARLWRCAVAAARPRALASRPAVPGLAAGTATSCRRVPPLRGPCWPLGVRLPVSLPATSAWLAVSSHHPWSLHPSQSTIPRLTFQCQSSNITSSKVKIIEK